MYMENELEETNKTNKTGASVEVSFQDIDLPVEKEMFLDDIWGKIPTREDVPTYTPARFGLQHVIVRNGGSSHAYIYDTLDNAWFDVAILPIVVTQIPKSVITIKDNSAVGAVDSKAPTQTSARIGQVILPFSITVNKVSIIVSFAVNPSEIYFSMFSEDGQTQYFNSLAINSSTTGLKTTSTASPVTLAAGIYYVIVTSSDGPGNVGTLFYDTETVNSANLLFGTVTSEPVVEGTLAVVGGSIPDTITPSAITSASTATLFFRLDN